MRETLDLSPRYIGLDLETTAGNHEGRIVEVGLAWVLPDGSPDWWSEVVRPPGAFIDRSGGLDCPTNYFSEPDYDIDPDSMKIHAIPPEEIVAAEAAYEVDSRAVAALSGLPEKLIPVGFGVSTFDKPFILREMGSLASRMGHRTVNLTDVVTAMSLSGHGKEQKIKKKAKSYAEEQAKLWSNGPARWHRAGFDALVALFAFQYLIRELSRAKKGK